MDKYIRRNIENVVFMALEDTPVILIQGARQVGKSTLLNIIGEKINCKHITLDDATALEFAKSDPITFVEQFSEGTLIIDEVQLCPQLLRSIKYSVDKNRRPGRFILTGSANVLHVTGANESLTGRIETIRLNPFSQGELHNTKEDFITSLVKSGKPDINTTSKTTREDYVNIICSGGYPDVVFQSARRQDSYIENYLTGALDHDAVAISGLAHLDKLGQVFSILSAQTSGELIQAKLSKITGIPESSIHGYIRLLKDLYLINDLPAWGRNLTKRAVSRKKVSIADTAIACHLNKDTRESLLDITGGSELGSLLETFVTNELLKQQSWSDTRFSMYHYRDRSGREVDIIIELSGKKIIPIEIKSSRTISKSDLTGIKTIREMVGNKFLCGIVLYTGKDAASFGEDIYGVPISTLWS